MTIRFYVIPIERTASLTQRGPKYFKWRYDPNPPGINCPYYMMDYGDVDVAFICADILDADHTALIANSDVLSLPLNLDQNLTAPAVTAAQNFLEAINIPAGWVSTALTYRQVARLVCAMFQFMQRVTFYLGHSITLPQNWANLTISQIPVDIRDAMAAAAASFYFDYSAVTGSTTIRQVLKGMADAWGSTPLQFGLAVL